VIYIKKSTRYENKYIVKNIFICYFYLQFAVCRERERERKRERGGGRGKRYVINNIVRFKYNIILSLYIVTIQVLELFFYYKFYKMLMEISRNISCDSRQFDLKASESRVLIQRGRQ